MDSVSLMRPPWGHVRIYQNVDGEWTQIGEDIDGETAGDFSGESVSLSSDGSIVAIGAAENDGSGISSGHTRIYQLNSTNKTIDGSSPVNSGGDGANQLAGKRVMLCERSLWLMLVR